ncbi:cobalt/nickel ECF transporter CbiMNQO, T component CbiQ [Campylobacter blaseri]|uniref:Cobalt ABC transporter permease n=1 Tax=Campylobacter blaseri TaxID=2042961 RepID=A0A2P8R0U5_9BACT|nr:energy-coupling factor transporter transmembrane component T [Campylobacter blaseri]PSM52117.1 cobalt ABC transporter permease [Campylobacter blaseri]PSM53883.1 cobalt ABC transporter permease [Campylobacter blaseri]QKF85317.1 cobalt/nickel ECF transporter CbiMNQO, T component CbiQ [Campylobacter blaseri]
MKNISFLIICFIVFAFNVALSANIYLIFFLPILILLTIRYKNIFDILKRLFWLNIFIIAVVLSLAYHKDYQNAMLIFLRSNLIITFMLAGFYNIDEFKIVSSISNLGVGDKLSSLFYFTAKFLYIIKDIFVRFKKTLKSRGFNPKFSLFSYKVYGNLVAMIFLNAFYKANILEKTILARGYRGNLHRQKECLKLSFFEISFGIIIFLTMIFKKGGLI